MNTKDFFFRMAFFMILLLTASAGFNRTGSPLQQTKVLPSGTQTQLDEFHEESESRHFCRVVMVPVKGPPPTIRLMQSTGQFSIDPTFHTNVTAEQRVVIRQAISEWEEIIETRGFTAARYPIDFSNGPISGDALGWTGVTVGVPSGDLYSAEITFNNDSSTAWYVDPTPADDAEFDDSPPSGYDLLTVARHEIGHAVGWVESARVENLLSNSVFDVSRLNIATTYPESMHTDPDIHADDIMCAVLGSSTRRSISIYPSCALVARAYHYDLTMRFVDSFYEDAETGSVNEPWNTFTEGISL
ncbi:MAG: zinc metalloprotease, partial [Planctomycetota bacterium]